ncbi:MAG: rRNA-processing protein las1 [Sclerophora amabilis]|nr:MAG: rRNA-processing protein las1 [Sclerophora amabilis]
MPRLRPVPWKGRRDLLRVRGQLYRLNDSRQDERREAIDTVRAWKTRGDLPHLVESTALLVDALLNDDEARASPWSIRSAYSTAFSRFVTGLLDSEQTAKTKRSMHNIAQELGMPPAFVDLRHQVTHEDMPSLEVLRHATQRSLNWLWDYYWHKLDIRTGDLDFDDAAFREGVVRLKEHFRNLLRRHIRQEIEAVKGGAGAGTGMAMQKRKRRPNDVDDPVLDTCGRCVRVCRGKTTTLRELAAVLVERKILIPASRSIGDSMDRVFILWDVLLQLLAQNQSRFLGLLVTELLAKISEPSTLDVRLDDYREAAHLWLVHIFTHQSWTPLHQQHPSVDLNDVVKTCLVTGPNYWTLRLAKLLVADDDNNNSSSIQRGRLVKRQWGDMVEMAERLFAGLSSSGAQGIGLTDGLTYEAS